MNVSLGFCFWDIIALIILLAVVIGFGIRTRKLSKTQKELEDQLSDRTAQEVSGANKPVRTM